MVRTGAIIPLDVRSDIDKTISVVVGCIVGGLVPRETAVGSMLTLASDVGPAWAAYDSIEDASAPEEIAVVISLLTLPSTSESCCRGAGGGGGGDWVSHVFKKSSSTVGVTCAVSTAAVVEIVMDVACSARRDPAGVQTCSLKLSELTPEITLASASFTTASSSEP